MPQNLAFGFPRKINVLVLWNEIKVNDHVDLVLVTEISTFLPRHWTSVALSIKTIKFDDQIIWKSP